MHHVHFEKENFPEFFKNYFKTNADKHNYATRQNKHYTLKKSKRKWGDKMLINKAAQLWNNLDNDLKSIHNFQTFSSKLKKTSISKY